MSAMSAPAIEMEHVDLAFGNDTGVFDVSYTVPSGTILGMIGPSGCGKTTNVRLMTGLAPAQRGTIRVLGKSPSKFTSADRERIGYIPQSFVLYPTLTVAENMTFVASLYGMGWRRRRRRMRELLEFVDLSDARNRLGRELSGGMQRRLMLACALMHEPDLIFADEPTAGIDPVLRGRFWEYFRQLSTQGKTLFITTQYVGEAAYCDQVAVMRKGRILDIDTPEQLRRKAVGGEVVALTFERMHIGHALDYLNSRDDVLMAKMAPASRDQIHVYVERAGPLLPVLLKSLEDDRSLQVLGAEEFTPSYDDVFITLMERSEKEAA